MPRITPERAAIRTTAHAGLRHAAAWLAISGLLLAATGCRPPADRVDPARPVEVELLTTPARVGPAAIEVRLSVAGAPATGATVAVVGDMTHAGMAPVVASTVAEVAPGVYRTQGFAFDMVGDWEITADVRYTDGVVRRGSLHVRVDR